jgi:hypothetical protein
MDLRTLIGTLIEAADKHADTLHERCSESLNDATKESHDAYQTELDETNTAIDAGRAWLARPRSGPAQPDCYRHDGRRVQRRLLDGKCGDSGHRQR